MRGNMLQGVHPGADDGALGDFAGVVCGAVCGVAENFQMEMMKKQGTKDPGNKKTETKGLRIRD